MKLAEWQKVIDYAKVEAATVSGNIKIGTGVGQVVNLRVVDSLGTTLQEFTTGSFGTFGEYQQDILRKLEEIKKAYF